MTYGIDRMRQRKKAGRSEVQSLDSIVAKVFIKACTPPNVHTVADLQDGLQTGAKSAAHKTQMPAVSMRHQFEDGVCLPVAFDSDYNAFISPVHGRARHPPWRYSALYGISLS